MIVTVCQVKCDGCGALDVVSLAYPQPASPEDARRRVADLELHGGITHLVWSRDADGRDLCGRCTTRAACGAQCHEWGDAVVMPEGVDMRPWRPCHRCGAVQDVETGEVTL